MPASNLTTNSPSHPRGHVATSYDRSNGGHLSLNGTEFWQKWTGGKNPTYSFSEGTDAGRLCMQASAIRSFYNWNDN